MHIPDGVLSPAVSAVSGAAMLPVWAIAGRRVRADLGTRQTPLLALGAAFCFTVMMFNIPALGGTTAHPVAGTLVAVLLGPWAACIGVSTALAIQALFFGDGGLLAYGANCFTMAFVLPFVGYSVYRLTVGSREAKAPVRAVAAAVGAYVGLNAAAAVVAVLLGIEPALFHEANGQALYFPFGLAITLPAMLGTHLLAAGPAEAVVTALVVRYFQASGLPLYGVPQPGTPATDTTRRGRRETLWIGLLALIALSPLGLLAKGDAWGEWDAQGLAARIKQAEGREYVPKGVRQAEEHGYKGVHGLEDYAAGEDGKNRLGYIGAAALGAGTIAALLLLGGRLLLRRERTGTSPNPLLRKEGANSGLPPSYGGANSASQETPPSQEGTHSASEGIALSHEGTASLRREGQAEAAPSPYEGEGQALTSPSPCEGEGRGGVLPDWLCRSSEETSAPPELSGRPSNRYVERTLSEIAAGAAATLAGDRWARQPGYLQRLDPRAKVIGVFGLITVTVCLRQLPTLLTVYALTLVLAYASRLPLLMLIKRVWFSVPVFVGALAMPAALNTVTPGRAVLVLWIHPSLAVTAPGLELAGTLMARVGTAVSLATLLTLTTPWNDLLRALRALFAPRLFLHVLAMTYRYLTVLLQTAAEMFVARRSRTVGRASNAEGRRFVGASIGALFGKTLALSEEVHAAMLSRGFTGEMRTLTRFRWRAADSLWTLAMLLIAVVMLEVR